MIIDHIEHYDLPDETAKKYGNELRSLAYLAEGLEALARQVSDVEQPLLEKQRQEGKIYFMMGAPEGEAQMPLGLLACAFHWYAVSACNYARLVGWLGNDEYPIRAAAYLERLLPSVLIWRNKVGAHFARANPRSEDTVADLVTSVIFPIAFENDAFHTSPLRLTLGRGATTTSSSRNDMKWSLTRTHDHLRRRYWPDGPPDFSKGPLLTLNT